MNTPVLFIIFKRYDTALQVFEAIREAKPPRLYVAADAPRIGIDKEAEDCQKTRDIIKLIDWECEVKTLFQTENQGCGIGPYKAISWFFANEEQGIVLEDDCLPHPDFFVFCEYMLGKYKSDPRIGLITGRCNFEQIPSGNSSYFLSAMHFCWGWASWRRVWEKYDYTLKNFSAFQYFRALHGYFSLKYIYTILWRMNIFFFCKNNCPKDIWDYQFCISTQINHQYTIVPKVNLVKNIGFDDRATHTGGGMDTKPVESIAPIEDMQQLIYNPTFDAQYSSLRFNRLKTVYGFIRNILHL